MPLFVVECDNVKTLSNSQIDLLRCGDYLVKKDASGEHAYKVTFKSETGMCLTYIDASVVETQSYDKVGEKWVYNSEDKTELPVNHGDLTVDDLLVESDAVIDNDLEVHGDLTVSGAINGVSNPSVKPIYCHPIHIVDTEGEVIKRLTCLIFNNNSTPFTLTSFKDFLDELNTATSGNGRLMCSGAFKDGTNICIVSYILKGQTGLYSISGLNTVGSTFGIADLSFDVIFPSATTTLYDGINKIN